jgi:hypothetical protein
MPFSVLWRTEEARMLRMASASYSDVAELT